MLIYTATGGANQQWRVTHDPKGYVTLANVNSGKVLTWRRLREGRRERVAVLVERRP